MAKKQSKKDVVERVEKHLRQGDVRKAVDVVRAAKLSEAAFDDIMAEHEHLRDAYHAAP